MDKGFAVPVMGWGTSGSSTSDMWSKIKNGTSKGAVLFEVDGSKDQATRRKALAPSIGNLHKGDLIYRINAKEHPTPGHVAWFDHWDGDPGTSTPWITAAHSPTHGVGTVATSISSILENYTGAFRPFTAAGDTVAATPYGARGPT